MTRRPTRSPTAIWYNAGQTCHAGSRLIVDRAVKDDLVARICAWAPNFTPGDPLDPETTMGSMIEPEALESVEQQVEIARGNGARIPVGGRRAQAHGRGVFYEPTAGRRCSARQRDRPGRGVRPRADCAWVAMGWTKRSKSPTIRSTV
ncbi:MAG: aldehyde dehydrogenase family protein [Rhodovibrio sp.]|nr:aldehyde dehydrogenase family protein [Rhodovibrio sp.]